MSIEAPEAPERIAYSPQEAAAAIGISHTSVRTLLALGRLHHTRVGRRILISRAALDEFFGEPVRPPGEPSRDAHPTRLPAQEPARPKVNTPAKAGVQPLRCRSSP